MVICTVMAKNRGMAEYRLSIHEDPGMDTIGDRDARPGNSTWDAGLMTPPPGPRRRHPADPLRVSVAVAILAVWLALYGVLRYRAALEAIPEIGRATPLQELRAAWAEGEEEARVPATMPRKRSEK